MKTISTFKRMHNLLFQGQSFIVQFTCIGLLALLGIAILSRNILRFDLVKGTEELLSLMSAWLYFIGGSIASYEDSHISADLIATSIKSEIGHAVHAIYLNVVMIAACTIGSIWAFNWVLWTIQQHGKAPTWHYPLYIVYLPVFIFLVLTVGYYIWHFTSSIKSLTEAIKNRKLCKKGAV